MKPIVGMTARALLGLALVLVFTSSLAAQSSPIKMNVNIFNPLVEEQTGAGCPNLPATFPVQGGAGMGPLLVGDSLASAPTQAYNFPIAPPAAPWTTVGVISSTYNDGQFCNPSTNVCLGVQFNKAHKTLSVDTRGTLGPRTATLNFSVACSTCGYNNKDFASGFFNAGAGLVNTTYLLSIFMDTSFTDMGVCSSNACPESQPAWARLWFDDPAGNDKQDWRVEWGTLRVLRMSTDTWYVVASPCDGTQVAKLYKLEYQKRNPTVSLQGYYLMTFFMSGVKQTR